MTRPIEVTTVSDFRREVERASEPTLVMFTTSWCPFCRRFKPKFVEAATKADVRSVITYIDDWENPLWDEYKIDVVPTLVLFEGGKPAYRRDGILGRGLGEKDLQNILAHLPQAARP
jgi:thioredoxin 1